MNTELDSGGRGANCGWLRRWHGGHVEGAMARSSEPGKCTHPMHGGLRSTFNSNFRFEATCSSSKRNLARIPVVSRRRMQGQCFAELPASTADTTLRPRTAQVRAHAVSSSEGPSAEGLT